MTRLDCGCVLNVTPGSDEHGCRLARIDWCRDHAQAAETKASHDRLLEAVAKLTKLPNWQNRLGSWTDVIDAVQDIAIAAVPKE